ncbi:hypothetical protein [Arsenophonus apicola]|uniref:Phage protein n=1 Tax=Arsenophonus apicola TaxID=2879119 RepID=A0ABY8P5K4_9GAMM|nr:hypothetical protein [Arsenophonus apicola]WGO82340.1 hypothetical protein QG404_00980 [Arsenophonus apicola]WGO84487.1 hypothetical protein QG404_06300 [Arsenophonus apicola]
MKTEEYPIVKNIEFYINEASIPTLNQRREYIEIVFMNKLYSGIKFMKSLPKEDKELDELLILYQKAWDFFVENGFMRRECN